MSVLFFDTETNGLPDFKARSADPSQPHLVQLALVETDDDGSERESICVIVRPDGWVISPEMTAIHGISQERAMDEGVPEQHAAGLFLVAQARSRLRVAHNESFDRRILRIAMTRPGFERDVIEATEARQAYCTCNAAKPVVNLPPTDKMIAVGFTGPKPPRLGECIKHFFGEDFPGAHDAMIDARACARVYWRLQSLAKPAALVTPTVRVENAVAEMQARKPARISFGDAT